MDDIIHRLLDSEEHATEDAIPLVAEDAADEIKKLRDRVTDLENAARSVLANWEHGDLAGAVNWLDGTLGEN